MQSLWVLWSFGEVIFSLMSALGQTLHTLDCILTLIIYLGEDRQPAAVDWAAEDGEGQAKPRHGSLS